MTASLCSTAPLPVWEQNTLSRGSPHAANNHGYGAGRNLRARRQG